MAEKLKLTRNQLAAFLHDHKSIRQFEKLFQNTNTNQADVELNNLHRTDTSRDDHTQYHNDARALTWLGTRSTSDLPEGTNLYHTVARVVAVIASTVTKAFVEALGISHGSTTDLLVDDHTQYSLADGTRDYTGVVVGVTPTLAAHLATKGYVDSNDFWTRTGTLLSPKTAGDSAELGGSQDAVQLTIKGNASQTANIQEWQNSASSVYAGISGDGDFFVNTDLIFADRSLDFVGINTATPMSTLESSGSVGTKLTVTTGNFTMNEFEHNVVSDTSGGGGAPTQVNLPAASSCAGREYNISSKYGNLYTVTVKANGAETINGSNTFDLTAAEESISIQSDGTEWYIVK